MDINTILKAKNAWERFTRNHPRFPMFLNAAKAYGIKEGTVLEFHISNPGEETLIGNIRITADDLELFESIKELK
ncbi:MAG: hypothetical protein Q4E54_03275 [Lachnospiraceae bacterium]|nr:hypothetical protein [Lachnospiraceae bacterium]